MHTYEFRLGLAVAVIRAASLRAAIIRFAEEWVGRDTVEGFCGPLDVRQVD